MSKQLDFYYDFGSPTTYLAHKRLGQLSKQYGLQVNYKPILLGGLFKGSGNTSPVTIPAKGKYMLESDMPRFAKRYGVPLTFNPHFPINTLNLMRGAIAAERLDCADTYITVMYDAVWVDGKNMGEPEVVAQTLTSAGLDAAAIMTLSQDPAVKTQLIDCTDAALALGLFGAPTMFMDGQMYFGQDRLDFIEEALKA